MADDWDVAVVGAGPAGGTAARVAAQSGARVVLIDEQARPGGQVWRANDITRDGPGSSLEAREGDRHRAALEASAVTFLGQTRLWHIEAGGDYWQLHLLSGDACETLAARSVVLAPGAREFVQPFPGWTTPGVIGLAGATALMKSQQCVPGGRVMVAGAGPLAIYAAAEILRLGGDVAAVVTPNTRGDWLRAAPALVSNPTLARRGATMLRRIRRAGVPILWRHLVTHASGPGAVQAVRVARCDADWTPVGAATEMPAGALAVGHGLLANSDVAALAGLELRHDPARGGWIAATGRSGETTLPGLFLCGDGAGLMGAAAAQEQGERAGAAAAASLGGDFSSGVGLRRSRAARFGAAMTALALPRDGLVRLTDSDTIVCRCENLTRATLDAAIDAGATSLGALKSATRCGMGPCGGRYCMTAAARLVGVRTGLPPARIAPPTARPPLFPVPVAALATGFAYDDLPMPTPAPL